MAECFSESAAFPEEAPMEQHNPAVSSECESLESSNMNIDACTSQSMNIYIQEGASRFLLHDSRLRALKALADCKLS